MSATLTWLDHDNAARERMRRTVALFEERNTLDELGLGGIRDSLADLLFPGTSTIQTRLRYMLFVPWMYLELERRRVSSSAIAGRARDYEYRLSEALLKSADQDGVFGKVAGRQLKRRASSVYWNGLASWGIRRFRGSQDQYHAALDGLYWHRVTRRGRADDGDYMLGSGTVTWHPGLPPCPDALPDAGELALTNGEAEFLQDRIVESHRPSLLAHLALTGGTLQAGYAWELPQQAEFSEEIHGWLHHGRLFSATMLGAAILYNLMLAEERGDTDRIEGHRGRFADWARHLSRGEIAGWKQGELWVLARGNDHFVGPRTQHFVEEWTRLALLRRNNLADDAEARNLVRARERSLKGPRSRFDNRRALDQWSGESMAAPLSFRWRTARSLLQDLHAGLRGG